MQLPRHPPELPMPPSLIGEHRTQLMWSKRLADGFGHRGMEPMLSISGEVRSCLPRKAVDYPCSKSRYCGRKAPWAPKLGEGLGASWLALPATVDFCYIVLMQANGGFSDRVNKCRYSREGYVCATFWVLKKDCPTYRFTADRSSGMTTVVGNRARASLERFRAQPQLPLLTEPPHHAFNGFKTIRKLKISGMEYKIANSLFKWHIFNSASLVNSVAHMWKACIRHHLSKIYDRTVTNPRRHSEFLTCSREIVATYPRASPFPATFPHLAQQHIVTPTPSSQLYRNLLGTDFDSIRILYRSEDGEAQEELSQAHGPEEGELNRSTPVSRSRMLTPTTSSPILFRRCSRVCFAITRSRSPWSSIKKRALASWIAKPVGRRSSVGSTVRASPRLHDGRRRHLTQKPQIYRRQ